MSAVEEAVCSAVNEVFEALRPGAAKVSASGLYLGKGNVALPVATARHFCFRLLHDVYGLTYSCIARRAGMSPGAVMKKVRKVRQMVFTDEIYILVDALARCKMSIDDGLGR